MGRTWFRLQQLFCGGPPGETELGYVSGPCMMVSEQSLIVRACADKDVSTMHSVLLGSCSMEEDERNVGNCVCLGTIEKRMIDLVCLFPVATQHSWRKCIEQGLSQSMHGVHLLYARRCAKEEGHVRKQNLSSVLCHIEGRKSLGTVLAGII